MNFNDVEAVFVTEITIFHLEVVSEDFILEVFYRFGEEEEVTDVLQPITVEEGLLTEENVADDELHQD